MNAHYIAVNTNADDWYRLHATLFGFVAGCDITDGLHRNPRRFTHAMKGGRM